MKRLLLVALSLVCCWSGPVKATTINFDDVTAPNSFPETTHLTNHYSSLGVYFSGPGNLLDGGAILNQLGNWGVNALSGENFLAFNRESHLSDGGVPRDPETILFDNPMGEVSIYAAGAYMTSTFRMDAYDADGVLVGTDTVSALSWEQLTVSYGQGIRKAVLTETGGYAFVYDDLSFNSVPEPATICLLGLGALSLLRRKR